MTAESGASVTLRERVARWLAPDLAAQADRATAAVEVAEHHCYSTPHRATNTLDRPYMEGASLGRAQVVEVLRDGWRGGDSPVLHREMTRLHGLVRPRATAEGGESRG